jgi:hypothetical protein
MRLPYDLPGIYLYHPRLAIIISIIIIIVTLIESLKSTNDGETTTTTTSFGDTTIIGVKPTGTSIFIFMENLSSILYLHFKRSINIYGINESEMKNPEQFSKTTKFILSNNGICVYCSCSNFLWRWKVKMLQIFYRTLWMGPSASKTTIGVLVVFHLIVSYVIAIQPFPRMVA